MPSAIAAPGQTDLRDNPNPFFGRLDKNGGAYSATTPTSTTAAEAYSRILNLLAERSTLISEAERSEAWLADCHHSRRRFRRVMLLVIIVIVVLGQVCRKV